MKKPYLVSNHRERPSDPWLCPGSGLSVKTRAVYTAQTACGDPWPMTQCTYCGHAVDAEPVIGSERKP